MTTLATKDAGRAAVAFLRLLVQGCIIGLASTTVCVGLGFDGIWGVLSVCVLIVTAAAWAWPK